MTRKAQMMTDPHPFDGRPYYCRICGLGYGEFLACENDACALEDEQTSAKRKRNFDAQVERNGRHMRAEQEFNAAERRRQRRR